MTLVLKEQICDRAGLLTILDQMAIQICEDDLRLDHLAFIGILKGGAALADYLAKQIGQRAGHPIPVAYVDISLYRDDMIDTSYDPNSRSFDIPFALKNRDVVLIDDVLFTGRTVRAALTSILALGRPRVIRLGVVVDRGFRELPIHADYVGMTLKPSLTQGVRVRTLEPDSPGIYLYEETSKNG